jgi:hypothetical protein
VKLTLVTDTFPPGINGEAMIFGHIARELGRRGPQATICHPRRDDFANDLLGVVAAHRLS